MRQGYQSEIKRCVITLALGLWLGWLVGYPLWGLLAGTGVYLSRLMRQLVRLNRWLLRADLKQPPPEASGIWGDVFDNIFHMQRHQRDEKETLQAVVTRVQETTSALKDGVILVDERGHLDFWNPAAHRLLGFHSRDQGQSVINFIRHPRFVSYFEGGDYSEPLEMPSPRFASKQLQFQVTRFGKNERLILVRDMTRLHKLERMRQDFVANVSHELRTPLTVINGYVETFLDHNTQPAFQKPLEQMQQQSKRMALLINDLITLSRLETTEVETHTSKISLSEMLKSIQQEAHILAEEKNQQIHLAITEPILLKGNDQELRSAFSNLIFNAIKYTPAEGVIRIATWQDDDAIYVQVADNGPGIDQKHLPRLTERFYRVDASRNSHTGGTGLGLAIVKHVLLRHDAELLIDSELNQGSRFTCKFSKL